MEYRLNIPGGVPSRTARGLEEAKTAFRESWTRFKAGIEPALYAEAIEEAKAARTGGRLGAFVEWSPGTASRG